MDETNAKHAQESAAKNPLSWIPEFLTLTDKRLRSQTRLLGTAVLVGIGTGVAGVLFTIAVQVVMYFALWVGVGYQSPEPTNEHFPSWLEHLPAWMPQPRPGLEPWLLLLIPSAGGLLCGVLVFTVAPEAEGHGTDAVIAAYHDRKGKIRYRVPIVKTFASAFTIGTGGSGGPEGPITQIGGGLGYFLGSVFGFSNADRRVLLAAGMGAGIAAILRARWPAPCSPPRCSTGRPSSSRKYSCRPASPASRRTARSASSSRAASSRCSARPTTSCLKIPGSSGRTSCWR